MITAQLGLKFLLGLPILPTSMHLEKSWPYAIWISLQELLRL